MNNYNFIDIRKRTPKPSKKLRMCVVYSPDSDSIEYELAYWSEDDQVFAIRFEDEGDKVLYWAECLQASDYYDTDTEYEKFKDYIEN